jgi:hypothetical protein
MDNRIPLRARKMKKNTVTEEMKEGKLCKRSYETVDDTKGALTWGYRYHKMTCTG